MTGRTGDGTVRQHHPVRTLTALATGLAVTTMMFSATTPRASAATRPSVRHGEPDAPGTALLQAARPLTGALPVRAPGEPPDDILTDLAPSAHIGQQLAESLLSSKGIGWRSTGNCSDRNNRTCTSFENIRVGTLKGLVGFALSSGCPITVTGGTERGHATSRYSHWNGYKIDISTGRCVDGAVGRFPRTGVRGDGAQMHRSPDNGLYAREKDHWDITYR